MMYAEQLRAEAAYAASAYANILSIRAWDVADEAGTRYVLRCEVFGVKRFHESAADPDQCLAKLRAWLPAHATPKPEPELAF